jgi:cytochrome b
MTTIRNHGEAASVSPVEAKLLVWDPVVRALHWVVALGCALDLFVFDDGKATHRYIGYAVFSALIIRVVWGFVGTRRARFSDFTPSLRQLADYLSALIHGREPRYVGHNPAGAVMILTLMALLAAVSITGVLLTSDANFGNERLEAIHEAFANAILVFAGLHAAAAIVTGWRHKENLVLAMITGYKRR